VMDFVAMSAAGGGGAQRTELFFGDPRGEDLPGGSAGRTKALRFYEPPCECGSQLQCGLIPCN
jgi:hypothetical protein